MQGMISMEGSRDRSKEHGRCRHRDGGEGRTVLSSDMLKKLVSGKTVDWTGSSKLVPTKSGDGCGIEIDRVY